MTDLLPSEERELEALFVPREDPAPADKLARLVDENFAIVDRAYADLGTRIARLEKRPPRERRTGAAARVNPDNIHVFYGVLAGSLLLPLFTFAASFAFQRDFGKYTPLEQWWWWVIPCILELPLVVLTPMILVFRRRHESTVGPWALAIALTAAAAAINFIHAVDERGLVSPATWSGALFVASWPVLTLVTFKFFARLAVKPEKPEPIPARKTPTKKGPRK
jgi:hypothetical protein